MDQFLLFSANIVAAKKSAAFLGSKSNQISETPPEFVQLTLW
jgi:hypothetical protein